VSLAGRLTVPGARTASHALRFFSAALCGLEFLDPHCLALLIY
jgi:hypothetical protein